MPNSIQSRGDDASRNGENRAEKLATPLVALATLVGSQDELFAKADRETSVRGDKIAGIKRFHDNSYKTQCDALFDLLSLIPQGDDRDLMILAGTASMLADQLPDIVAQGDTHGERLAKGILDACTAISATLAANWPAGPESVATLYPELARSIRRDMMITEARRADAEGQ